MTLKEIICLSVILAYAGFIGWLLWKGANETDK